MYISEADKLLKSFADRASDNPSVTAEKKKFVVTKDMRPARNSPKQGRLNELRKRAGR